MTDIEGRAAELTDADRHRRWKACQDQRAVARRERRRRAEACCLDCGRAGRDDPIEQATYHTRLAKQTENEAHRAAADVAERAAHTAMIGAVVLAVVSLVALCLAAVVMLGG